jgi:hypothetical protein
VTIAVVWDGRLYSCTPLVEPQPEPEPEPAHGRVIAYSQRDPRWASQVYAGGTTFAQAGCLVTCVAMIASLAYADAPLPPDVARALRDAGAFNGALLSNPARIPVALNRLEWGGVAHWRERPADLDMLASEIAAYGAAICEVKWNPRGAMPQNGNQHFVVVEGLDGADAQIVDPWDGQRKALSESRYRLPGWTVARTLYGMRMVRPVGEAGKE